MMIPTEKGTETTLGQANTSASRLLSMRTLVSILEPAIFRAEAEILAEFEADLRKIYSPTGEFRPGYQKCLPDRRSRAVNQMVKKWSEWYYDNSFACFLYTNEEDNIEERILGCGEFMKRKDKLLTAEWTVRAKAEAYILLNVSHPDTVLRCAQQQYYPEDTTLTVPLLKREVSAMILSGKESLEMDFKRCSEIDFRWQKNRFDYYGNKRPMYQQLSSIWEMLKYDKRICSKLFTYDSICRQGTLQVLRRPWGYRWGGCSPQIKNKNA